MNRRGAELSFNVIVIAILVILVLVVIAAFFLGGFAKLSDLIIGVSPDDLETSTRLCDSNCLTAQNFGSDRLKQNSAYCRKTWKFDYSPEDGEIDRNLEGNVKRYHCYENPISVTCPGVSKDLCEQG